MPARLQTPHGFRERLLIYGEGGVGKTTACLSVARQMATGHMFVVDNDDSYAWQRALETDYRDCIDRVTVRESNPRWEDATTAIAEMIDKGSTRDDVRDCWLVIDSASPLWDAVQRFTTEAITGTDRAAFLAELRASAADASEMSKQLMDQVPWHIVKSEYAERVNIPVRQWPGHLILTAETKRPGRGDLQKPELASWYQHLGAMPAGETRIHYVTSSTLYLSKPTRGQYRVTTVKDRNRNEVEGLDIDDFAVSYLRDIAGWKVTVVRDD
jgi:hypothetical protein